MKKTKSKTPSMQGAKQNKTHIIAGCGVLTAGCRRFAVYRNFNSDYAVIRKT